MPATTVRAWVAPEAVRFLPAMAVHDAVHGGDGFLLAVVAFFATQKTYFCRVVRIYCVLDWHSSFSSSFVFRISLILSNETPALVFTVI